MKTRQSAAEAIACSLNFTVKSACITGLVTPSGAADDLEEDDPDLDLGDPDDLDEEDDSDLDDADDLDAEDDLSQDQDQDDPDDGGMGIFRQALDQSARPADADATPSGGLLDDDSAGAVDKTAGLSKHERQQARMQERIAKLEAQNMAEKDWFMQGESAAGKLWTFNLNVYFANNFECLNLNRLNHGLSNLSQLQVTCLVRQLFMPAAFDGCVSNVLQRGCKLCLKVRQLSMPAADSYVDVPLVGCKHNCTLHSSGSSYSFSKACVKVSTISVVPCCGYSPPPTALSGISKCASTRAVQLQPLQYCHCSEPVHLCSLACSLCTRPLPCTSVAHLLFI